MKSCKYFMDFYDWYIPFISLSLSLPLFFFSYKCIFLLHGSVIRMFQQWLSTVLSLPSISLAIQIKKSPYFLFMPKPQDLLFTGYDFLCFNQISILSQRIKLVRSKPYGLSRERCFSKAPFTQSIQDPDIRINK